MDAPHQGGHTDLNEQDDLQEFIDDCAQEDPRFPDLVKAALQERHMLCVHDEDPNNRK